MSDADRRRAPRLAVSSALRVVFGPQRAELSAQLVDICPIGMCLSVPNVRIAEEVLLQVRLSRSDGRGATALGRVVRCDPRGIAFCFDALWVSDEVKLASPDLWQTQKTDPLQVLIGSPRWWQFWGPPVSSRRVA